MFKAIRSAMLEPPSSVLNNPTPALETLDKLGLQQGYILSIQYFFFISPPFFIHKAPS